MKARNEKLVYRGKIFRVYQWRQRMFDGSYRTFERIERPSGARVIAVMDGKIAIARESQPGSRGTFKGFLGGRIEEGERPLAAAKRELLEEAGMKARRWKALRKFTMPTAKIKFDLYFFAAIGCRKVAEPRLESGERIKIRLVSLDQLLAMKDIREGPYFELFFMEMRHDRGLRRSFAKALGLSS
jgi:8-oxo-dGTP pyrophosphatase MutT (NUDIX family)